MPGPLRLTMLAQLEPERARAAIWTAVEATGGNVSHAAKALGIHRTTLLELLDRLDLRPRLAKRWPERRKGGQPKKAGKKSQPKKK